MLGLVFWGGTLLGTACGVVHAVHIMKVQSRLPGPDVKSMAFYRAAWALVLWTLVGGYLLIMWIFGLALRPIVGLFNRVNGPA
ncbi:MAG: hypothetical protein HKN11_04855 [Rhizobiales bacterium]|nr:hypothetical protein [Hyphomicrobiales bacterium]